MGMLGAMGMPALIALVLAFVGVWSLLFGGPTRGLLRH